MVSFLNRPAPYKRIRTAAFVVGILRGPALRREVERLGCETHSARPPEAVLCRSVPDESAGRHHDGAARADQTPRVRGANKCRDEDKHV